MGKLLQKLEQFIGGGPEGPKRVKTFRWLLLIGLLGIGIMVLNSFLQLKPIYSTDDINPSAANEEQQAFAGGDKDQSPFREYEAMYELRLRDILEAMIGVGEVDVMVTIDSTEELVVYRDLKSSQHQTEEEDRNGAKRHITDVTRSGDIVLYEVSGKQQPIILKKIKPKIRGIVVVARGAENLSVQKLIRDTVSRGLDVPVHRISVAPRKQK